MAQPMKLLVHLMSMGVHFQPFAVDAASVGTAVDVVEMLVELVELVLVESFVQKYVKNDNNKNNMNVIFR